MADLRYVFSGGRYLRVNRLPPGTPTLPDIDPSGGGEVIPDYPYFKPTEDKVEFYLGDTPTEYTIYTFTNSDQEYILYNQTFYTKQQFYEQEGATSTPSQIIDLGWYNPELNLYWVKDDRKWYSSLPQPESKVDPSSVIPSYFSRDLPISSRLFYKEVPLISLYQIEEWETKEAYFTTSGSSATSDTVLLNTEGNQLYDSTGSKLRFGFDRNYILVRLVDSSGTEYESSSLPEHFIGVNHAAIGDLALFIDSTDSLSVLKVVYRERKATLFTGYLSADKTTPLTIGPWTSRRLYDDNGSYIAPTEEEDRITIAFYYSNGEQFRNIDPSVLCSIKEGFLQVGGASGVNLTIEKVEYTIQPKGGSNV